MVPKGGGPPIAPTLQHFQDISNSIPLKHPQGGVKGDRITEVKSEGKEQLGESPLNGIRDITNMPDSNKLLVNAFLHRKSAYISAPQSAQKVRFTHVEVGVGGETQESLTKVDNQGGRVPELRGESVFDQRHQREVSGSSLRKL